MYSPPPPTSTGIVLFVRIYIPHIFNYNTDLRCKWSQYNTITPTFKLFFYPLEHPIKIKLFFSPRVYTNLRLAGILIYSPHIFNYNTDLRCKWSQYNTITPTFKLFFYPLEHPIKIKLFFSPRVYTNLRLAGTHHHESFWVKNGCIANSQTI